LLDLLRLPQQILDVEITSGGHCCVSDLLEGS
jgi:hypothetical protein